MYGMPVQLMITFQKTQINDFLTLAMAFTRTKPFEFCCNWGHSISKNILLSYITGTV